MIKIYQFDDVKKDEIFARNDAQQDVSGKVRDIIADVAARGDAAVKEYTAKFDGAVLDTLEVSGQEMDEAFTAVEPSFIEILKRAERNITRFHEKQVRWDIVAAHFYGIGKTCSLGFIGNIGCDDAEHAAEFPTRGRRHVGVLRNIGFHGQTDNLLHTLLEIAFTGERIIAFVKVSVEQRKRMVNAFNSGFAPQHFFESAYRRPDAVEQLKIFTE